MTLNIIKTNSDWFEATWKEDNIHVCCESYSGNNEHILMFGNKCIEYGTKTTQQDEQIIKEVQKAYVPISQEELEKLALKQKKQEADNYLKETDWVKDYKTRHDLGLDILPLISNKWVIINKRAEYVEFLKGL